MTLAYRLALTVLIGFFCLYGCHGEDASSSTEPDAAPVASDDGGPAAPTEACTDGFNASDGEPLRSFDELEAGRYCEVLIVYTDDEGAVVADVYNSLPFGACPQDAWDALDATAIQADFPDTMSVILNGPRYFLMQHLLDTPVRLGTPMLHTFGEIRMAKMATVVANQLGQESYTPTIVNRSNTWRFAAEYRVHELIDDEGQVYVMQSFSQFVDTNLSYDDLEDLGERLALPAGWRYRTRMLDADLDVTADGTATVIQDELQNTYQLRSDCQIAQ